MIESNSVSPQLIKPLERFKFSSSENLKRSMLRNRSGIASRNAPASLRWQERVTVARLFCKATAARRTRIGTIFLCRPITFHFLQCLPQA